MNIYLVLALIGFILVFKKLFSFSAQKTIEDIPPVIDENPTKNIHKPNYRDFFEDIETIKKVNSKDNIDSKKQYDKPANYTKMTNKTNNEEHKQIEIKEESEFDLKKAVIYSEILNNPYLSK